MSQWWGLAYCGFGFYQTLTILISSLSLSAWGAFLNMFSDRPTFLLSLSHHFTLSHLLGHTWETRKSWPVPIKQFPSVFFPLFFVFPHHDYSQQAFSRALFILLLSFYLPIQSLQPFRLHPSFLLVFNLSSSPSLFSPAAPCNANTTCSEGKWIIEAAAAVPSVQKWAAEEGRRERREEWRVDERNGEDRFVRTKAGGVQDAKNQRNIVMLTQWVVKYVTVVKYVHIKLF